MYSFADRKFVTAFTISWRTTLLLFKIRIEIGAEGSSLKMALRDFGGEVSNHGITRIFEKFYRRGHNKKDYLS